jgi:NADH:ubiquinone reductase (H+-translocating)
VPGLGASAMQMGKATAMNILRMERGEDLIPFTYVDKGSMATIGRNRAIAEVGNIHLSGLLAWLAWGLVHVMLLIGFKSKVLVLIEWVWSYFTGQGSVRLITGGKDRQ